MPLESCCVLPDGMYHFAGGILAGFASDKTDCSGITVVVMLVIAGPMVS